MKKLLLTILLLSSGLAYGNSIRFIGIITTAEVYLEPSGGIMGGIGDNVYGFVTFYPYNSNPSDLVITEAGIRFPGGWSTAGGLPYLSQITGSYIFQAETFGGFGEDGEIGFTLFLDGSGTFFGASYDPDGDGAYQRYTGDITSATFKTPETGSTAALMALALVVLLFGRFKKKA